jgi:hypothetical protein
MELWQKIGLGLIAAAALLFLLPGALRARKQDRKATADDWKGVLIPIALVIGFVVLLILMVS